MTPDLSALSSSFVKFGGQYIMKAVNAADYKAQGIQVYKNVKAPQALVKISAQGNPRPYRSQDDTAGNGVEYTDRLLTVYQSKWDMDVDPEIYRNTYLAEDNDDGKFYQYVLQQVSAEYIAMINDNTAWLGVYNAAGTTAAAIATGWGTIIANEITATNLTPVVTGAITNANAVTKVEDVVKTAPAWMRKKGMIVMVSYDVFDKYHAHYRTLNGYQYKPSADGEFKVDGVNAVIRPQSFMGTSQRIAVTVANNFCIGTDSESIKVAATARRNVIEMRPMYPVGFQIQDLEALIVNDQA